MQATFQAKNNKRKKKIFPICLFCSVQFQSLLISHVSPSQGCWICEHMYPCFSPFCFWKKQNKVYLLRSLFVLRFYSSINPMGSCPAWSIYLTTLLLGRLSPLSGLPVLCTSFCQKLTTALLESAEGREWPPSEETSSMYAKAYFLGKTRKILLICRLLKLLTAVKAKLLTKSSPYLKVCFHLTLPVHLWQL